MSRGTTPLRSPERVARTTSIAAMMAHGGEVPLAARIQIGHAALQWIAEAQGIRLLHIKGAALDPRVSWPGREGNDVDVLVPASDAKQFVAAMQSHGWRLDNSFKYSSAFEHAATLHHADLGWADVHRLFPGINLAPDPAFDLLWTERQSTQLGGFDCAVPSLPAQILVLVLHAARSPLSGRAPQDISSSWGAADAVTQRAVQRLVLALDAEVGFAAGVGDLDAYRGRRDHDLWDVVSHGGTRFEEWRARVKAAPSRRRAVTIALRAPLVNIEHLAMVNGRPPTRWEVLVEFFARPARGFREARRR